MIGIDHGQDFPIQMVDTSHSVTKNYILLSQNGLTVFKVFQCVQDSFQNHLLHIFLLKPFLNNQSHSYDFTQNFST